MTTSDDNKEAGFAGQVLSGVSSVGGLWRRARQTMANVAATARAQAEGLQQTASDARSFLNSLTPEGQEVRSRWAALQERIAQGMSDAVSGLKGLATVSQEVLSGMDQRLALRLLELVQLEPMAEARCALTLPALVKAKSDFQTIKETLENDPRADIGDALRALDRAIVAARTAVEEAPASTQELRTAYIFLSSTTDEIRGLVREYSEQSSMYVERFGDLPTARDPKAINGIDARLIELGKMVTSDDASVAVVPLCLLRADAAAVRDGYAADIEFFTKQVQTLNSLEGLMGALLRDAEASGCNSDSELLIAFRGFLGATRKTPKDIESAKRCKDNYAERLEKLQGLD
jgi:hypothetical protein